jgi:hypothetical protein
MCVNRSYLKSSDYVDVIKKNLGRTSELLPVEDLKPIVEVRVREAGLTCECGIPEELWAARWASGEARRRFNSRVRPDRAPALRDVSVHPLPSFVYSHGSVAAELSSLPPAGVLIV